MDRRQFFTILAAATCWSSFGQSATSQPNQMSPVVLHDEDESLTPHPDQFLVEILPATVVITN